MNTDTQMKAIEYAKSISKGFEILMRLEKEDTTMTDGEFGVEIGYLSRRNDLKVIRMQILDDMEAVANRVKAKFDWHRIVNTKGVSGKGLHKTSRIVTTKLPAA